MGTITAAIRWYEADGWYGKNYRLYLEGFEKKADAQKVIPMMKKFAQKFHSAPKSFTTEIGLLENMETYRYVSLGPSWSCSNIKVNYEKFQQLIKEEDERLAEGRERRSYEKERREAMKQFREGRAYRF